VAPYHGEWCATSDSQASVNVEWRRVGNRKGAQHTHEQVGETTVTHVYCLWLQVIHLKIWTSFGCVLEKGRGMGTDRGVLGGGRVREVVARGTQSEGDDSFRPCCMKAVRGYVYAKTTTPGSTRCTRCTVCGRYVPRWNVGGHGLCECAWEGGHPQYCHRDDALEQED
jgi:hypothetical protein